MNKFTTSTAVPTRALKLEVLSNIFASFESFCLASGLEALREMMDHDARAICGPRHARGRERLDYWTLILGPKFSVKERKRVKLSRFYAISQIEGIVPPDVEIEERRC